MPNNQSDMQINNVADPGQWVIFNVDQVGQSTVMNFKIKLHSTDFSICRLLPGRL